MRLSGILLVIILMLIIFMTFGCTSNMPIKSQITYINSNYPFFNITKVSTDKADINHYTMNITITSSMPEETVKYANGSVINIGTPYTQHVNLSLWSTSLKENYNREFSNNVTLAYNDTKTLTFDLGSLFPGNYLLTVSTPSMNTTYNFNMWDYLM